MADITLNIYEKGNNEKIEKTYKAAGYKLMMGTVEDFMAIIDLDKIADKIEAAKMILKCYKQLMPILREVFPELTDDELRRVSADELMQTFIQIGYAIVEGFDVLKKGN